MLLPRVNCVRVRSICSVDNAPTFCVLCRGLGSRAMSPLMSQKNPERYEEGRSKVDRSVRLGDVRLTSCLWPESLTTV